MLRNRLANAATGARLTRHGTGPCSQLIYFQDYNALIVGAAYGGLLRSRSPPVGISKSVAILFLSKNTYYNFGLSGYNLRPKGRRSIDYRTYPRTN